MLSKNLTYRVNYGQIFTRALNIFYDRAICISRGVPFGKERRPESASQEDLRQRSAGTSVKATVADSLPEEVPAGEVPVLRAKKTIYGWPVCKTASGGNVRVGSLKGAMRNEPSRHASAAE